MNRLHRHSRQALPVVTVFVAAIALWSFTIRLFDIPEFLMPAPGALGQELLSNRDLYWLHSLVTITESAAGFAIGSVIGVVLAVFLSLSGLLERSFTPYLIMFTNIPIVAFAPVVVIYFGFGMASKIVTAAFLTFFPVVIYVLRGLKSADSEHRELFSVMRASGTERYWHLYLPSAVPFLFAALRVAATQSVLAAVVAEFIQASRGLGYLILTSAYVSDMVRLWSAVIVSSSVAVSFYLIVVVSERILVPWNARPAE